MRKKKAALKRNAKNRRIVAKHKKSQNLRDQMMSKKKRGTAGLAEIANSAGIRESGPLASLKQKLSGALPAESLPEGADPLSLFEQPRRAQHGHLSLPAFTWAGPLGLSPKDLAKKLTEQIKQNLPSFVLSCQNEGPFVNFVFQDSCIQKHLEAMAKQTALARATPPRPEHWVMDFASPNVAKHINIGHLRAAVQGQALVNLSRCFGVRVSSVNHLGDWGSQFGKLLWAYKKWGKGFSTEGDMFSSLAKLYVRFHEEAEKDAGLLAEARSLFQKLESGDPELKALWRRFVRLSLENYDGFWKILNIKHDFVLGESFYAERTEDVKSRLRGKGLLIKSEGAEVVFLEQNTPPCLISKSDGASTYAARDLAALIYRFEEMAGDKNFYITGSDQKLHFRQLFETAGKLKPQWAQNSFHLSFGIYRFKGKGKMSSRKGQAVYLKDILENAFSKVRQIIGERNPSLENKEETVRQVGAGALIFNDLMSDRIKDVDFDWNQVLDFKGNSGPFVQYSLVRSLSLLGKKKRDIRPAFSASFETETERQLAWRLLGFEEAVFQSFRHFKPHILARFLLGLAGDFNRFYSAQRILGEKRENDFLLLALLANRVLDKGLEILNVPRPKAM